MIVFTTHWALTTGIREVGGQYSEDKKYFVTNQRSIGHYCFRTSEVHPTLEAAMVTAKTMAQKRAMQLYSQAITFANESWQPKVIRLKEKT